MSPTPANRPRFRKRWLLIFPIAIILFAGAAFFVWASTPAGPTIEAETALIPSTEIQVETGDWLVFRPTNLNPTTGFILYPGGRVDYRSYAPLARDIAAQGYLVVIPAMPLSFAVFAPNTAAEVITAYPEIETWAVGGHSLGGAMAAHFVTDNANRVDGLALWAAYPGEADDLSDNEVDVISIYASDDGLATTEKIDASRSLLPSHTEWEEIEGGNHAQFGAYGSQAGDGVAIISPEEQQRQIVEAMVRFLNETQAKTHSQDSSDPNHDSTF